MLFRSGRDADRGGRDLQRAADFAEDLHLRARLVVALELACRLSVVVDADVGGLCDGGPRHAQRNDERGHDAGRVEIPDHGSRPRTLGHPKAYPRSAFSGLPPIYI